MAVHDLMLVLVSPQNYQAWMDKNADADQGYDLQHDSDYQTMEATPVGDWINKSLYHDPRCVEPVVVS